MNGMVRSSRIRSKWARTLAEKIQAFKTRLGGHDFETSLREHAFGEDESHRLVVYDQKRSPLLGGGWRRGGLLCPGKGSQLRMEQNLFVGTTGVFDQLRGHFGRAINAGAKHVEILLRPVIAFPDVLDGRAGAGNDFQQVVQLARGASGRLDRNDAVG